MKKEGREGRGNRAGGETEEYLFLFALYDYKLLKP